jgi:predicted transcriptional regulator
LTFITTEERVPIKETLSKFRPLGTEILLKLRTTPRDLNDLSGEIKSLKTSILHEIKRLRTERLVEKENRVYRLTSVGRVYAVLLHNFFTASNLIRTEKEFWLQHSLSSIPEQLLLRIGDLKESMIIRNDETHLGRIHESFLELLDGSEELNGISPVFHTDFTEAVAKMLMRKCDVRLIVTKDVIREIQRTVSKMGLGTDVLPLMERNLELFVNDNLELAMSATDTFISLGLFDSWGNYDYSADLVCTHPQGIQWGKDLFEYHLKTSKKIDTLAGFE